MAIDVFLLPMVFPVGQFVGMAVTWFTPLTDAGRVRAAACIR